MSGHTSRRRADISRGKRKVDNESKDEDDPEETTPVMKPSKKKSSSFEENYALLMRNDFAGTRYPHLETMEKIGILRDVEELFHNTHLTNFMNFQRESYKEEICQFLASLEIHFYAHPGKKPEAGLGFITFTFDDEYTFSINDVDELYGFPSGTDTCSDFDKDDLFAVWNTIGSERTTTSSRVKRFEIRNPAIRYFRKSIASTFFARKVVGTVNDKEVQLITLSLKRLLQTTSCRRAIRGDCDDTSFSVQMLAHLQGYCDWEVKHLSRGTKRVLSIGGMITPIFLACKFPLTTPRYEPRWLDIRHLKQAVSLARGPVSEKFIW